MRVKGLLALLTTMLFAASLSPIASAADLPSFEIKSVSSTLIDPGDTVTWKIQVNLVPGWVKYLSLTLRTPNGVIRSISALVDPKNEIKTATSREIILQLKTNSYDLAGKYKILYGYIANVSEYYAYDPINAKEYAGKGYMVAQNLSQFDITIRDSGTGVQKTPQLIESVGFAKSQVDPGSYSNLLIKTSGTGMLVSVNVQISTPDGPISAYCDATMQDQVSYCKDLVNKNGAYSLAIPIWTAEDSSPGIYKVTQINIGYKNGEGQAFINDTASWGGGVVYEDSNNIYDGVLSQKLSQFSSNGLGFTLLDAGQGIAQTPIWTELSWKNKSVKAGSTATLLISVDGFKRNIGSISVPLIVNLAGKNDVVYVNQTSNQTVRQIKPISSTSIFPSTKSGSFEVDVYIPRNTKLGVYAIGQIVILGTTCALTNPTSIYLSNPINNLNCQNSPNGWRTNYYLGSLTKDFGSASVAGKVWPNYINPQSAPIEVIAADPIQAPKLEELEVTPTSLEYRYLFSSEQNCIASTSEGELIDEKIQKEAFRYFKINNLKPNSDVTVKLTCTDSSSEKAESSIISKTAKPIPPASPKITLDSVTGDSALFSIGIREGFKYSVKSEVGEARITGNIEAGYKVLVNGLKPGLKTYLLATITDSFDQSTTTEPIYFSTELPPKPVKPVITAGKITTTRVEFKYEKLSNLDYELSVSVGEVSDIKGNVSISGLSPNTKVIASVKVIDQFGQSSVSDEFVIKSSIPELPLIPILYLSKASAESISLRFTPRAGMKFFVKSSAGIAKIDNGVISITGLSANQKIEVVLIMSDNYGQQKISEPYKYTTSQAPKVVAKTTITCVKGKASKIITAINPTCPTGYTKK